MSVEKKLHTLAGYGEGSTFKTDACPPRKYRLTHDPSVRGRPWSLRNPLLVGASELNTVFVDADLLCWLLEHAGLTCVYNTAVGVADKDKEESK